MQNSTLLFSIILSSSHQGLQLGTKHDSFGHNLLKYGNLKPLLVCDLELCPQLSRKLSLRVLLKSCLLDSFHQDKQNEWQQAYVWVKNNFLSILTFLTPLGHRKVAGGLPGRPPISFFFNTHGFLTKWNN